MSSGVDNNKWMLTKVQRSEHNHGGTYQASHPKLRSYFMTQEKVLENIRAQHESKSKPEQILTFLQNKYKLDSSNSVIGAKDIYNAIQKIRGEEIQYMTPIQALNVTSNNSERWWSRSN
jgi:IS30 family transposase